MKHLAARGRAGQTNGTPHNSHDDKIIQSWRPLGLGSGLSDQLSANRGGAGWTLPDVYGQQRAPTSDLAQIMAVTIFARNKQVEGSIPYSNATDMSRSKANRSLGR